MNEQLKNFFIGLFVITALSLFVSTILFLKPSVGDMKQTLHVRFSDINRISEGTRVLFAGKPVGEVVAIEKIGDTRDSASDSKGRVYYYELVLKIDSSVVIYNTDDISTHSSGLMGEKVISITPRMANQGAIPQPINANLPLYADSVDAFENAWMQLSDLATEMQGTFKEITGWMKAHGDETGLAVQKAGGALHEMERTLSSINEMQVVDTLHRDLEAFHTGMVQIQDLLDHVASTNLINDAAATMENFKHASAHISEVSDALEKGEGTLGRLLSTDDMYLNVNGLFSKLNTLMNDVNHYGILFHLNKNWQRSRLQKVTALNALNNPASFKSYFTNEVDQINTSMERISMLIDRAQNSQDREAILQNPIFQKDFAELMRRSEELSDHLRLYNEQLLDSR